VAEGAKDAQEKKGYGRPTYWAAVIGVVVALCGLLSTSEFRKSYHLEHTQMLWTAAGKSAGFVLL
jgi:hypothetical protein